MAIFILAELSPDIFCAGQRAFLGQLRALKGRSRTEDLGVKEMLRRIYFKVCMFGFDSSTDCLLLSGSNLDASLTPQSKAALPDTAPTVRHHPTAPEKPDNTTARQHRQPLQAYTRPHRLTAPTALDTDPTPPSPTAPDTNPTASDTTRHHPKTRQPPLKKESRGSYMLPRAI